MISTTSAAIMLLPGKANYYLSAWKNELLSFIHILAIRTSSRVNFDLRNKFISNLTTVDCFSISQNTSKPAKQIQDMVKPNTLERSDCREHSLISNDLQLQANIEKEFRKKNKFEITATSDDADAVFMVFSKYPTAIIKAGSSDFFWRGNDDSPYSTEFVTALAFAVTASEFQTVRKDIVTLSNEARWQSYADSRSRATKCGLSAQQLAAEFLVRKFHDEVLANNAQISKSLSSQGEFKASKSQHQLNAVIPKTSELPVAQQGGTIPLIKSETALVVVPFSVSDQSGLISGLSRGNFRIFEDNVEQEIAQFSSADVPFHVAILLDVSSSMRLRPEELHKSAIDFVSHLKQTDEVMVVSFRDEVFINCEFTNDRTTMERAIHTTEMGSGTRLYDAVDLVLTERLAKLPGRKAIVLFTDGVDTESRLTNSARNLALTEESGALIYTIHFNTSGDVSQRAFSVRVNDHVTNLPNSKSNNTLAGAAAYREGMQYLEDLAARTGAQALKTETAAELDHAFAQIAEDLRREYEISYYPTNNVRDGSYRRIRVLIDRPDDKVRARPGYRAAR